LQRSGAVSTLRHVKPDREVLENLGVRLSDALIAERLLLVEGPTDVDFLRAWFDDDMRRLSIEPVAMGGSDAARSIKRFARIADAGEALGRSVLFIRDRDELSASQVDDLQRAGLVHVLTVREMENFFLVSPESIAGALSARSSNEVSTAAVKLRLETLAGGFIERVIARRVVSRLGPVYLAPWAEVPEQPSLADLIAIADSSLAGARDTRSGIEQMWAEEERVVRTEWADRWHQLVPAAALLGELWKEFGLTFDKSRDGYELAKRTAPPDELRIAIDRLANQRH
jgi:hypothetical protein